MKQSIKAKKNHVPPKPAPQLPQPPSRFSPMRFGILVLVMLVTGGATWAVMEYVVWNNLPSELVGKWEVTQGPPEFEEAVFDFYRSGKMVGHLNDRGNLRVMNGEVRVEEKKFTITTRRPSTGEEHVTVQTIRTLNDSQFVLVDDKGRSLKMKRIQ